MKTVDGGEGGGQLLRSALSLSGITGTPVRVENVRGNRPDPGLKHQHLACVEAAAAVCDATVEGAELGSEALAFEPDPPSGGDVAVDVGTAGAITLVFETVLPFAVAIDEPLAVTATGGTDVAWSPPLAYYERVRLPLVRRFGWHAVVERDRRGFYPEGGGRATLHVAPSTSTRATLTDRGSFEGARVDAVASHDLADADVGGRMTDAAMEALREGGVSVRTATTRRADASSTGASVVVTLSYDDAVAGFSALGQPGTPAEAVGEQAVDDALAFHRAPSGPVVDEHAADQLVLQLALAGGRVRIPEMTEHVATNLALVQSFGFDVDTDDGGEEPPQPTPDETVLVGTH